MTPTTPLSDEDARRRVRTGLDRNVIVEAGAGTGKTRLLVDRVEALVASGRVRLRDVVAITFTEKAAAELRVRIRERIESHLRDAEAASDRFRVALEDLEIAPISTIHAFAADLLRERPVEAGVDPAFAVADELTASLFRTEAWDRWLEQQKEAGEGPLRELIDAGTLLRQLRALGDVLLRYRDVVAGSWDRGPAVRDPIAWLAAAEPEMRACIARVTTDCRNSSDKAVDALRSLERSLDLYARLGEAEVRREILSGLKIPAGAGNQGNWAAGALGEIKQCLGALRDDLDALRSAHAHYLAAGAVNWLRGYADVYQELKAREGILDFDDLLFLARNLLRSNRAVRAYFQQRFGVILVDEFQDTDPLQAEIILFLAEEGARADSWDQVQLASGKLFIVGDPKQSIYAFRRADIETYERVKQVLLRSGALEHITANFRSAAPILEAVNETFRGNMRPPADGQYQPDYVPLTPSPQTRSSDDAPALVLLYPGLAGDPDDNALLLRRREAEMLAAFLRHHTDHGLWKVGGSRRPASFGDVALLFRGMSDVPIYEEALKRYAIPYRVTSSRTFYRREEIGWLLNVLQAIEHPTDPVAVWGALRSPLFGCSDREVYAYVGTRGGSLDYRRDGGGGSSSVATAFAVLRALHEAGHRFSVPRMVEETLSRTHALETFLLLPQGEQRIANLMKVVTLAQALEGNGILTFRAFVHWLRDMETQAVDEAESPTVEEGDDVVRIMSIHAAKGLEFPIVIIPDLGRGPGGGISHLLIQRTKGLGAAFVGRVGDWPIQTQEYEAFKAHQASRDAAERLRVLYVAMTRAQDALVLPIFPQPASGSLQSDLEDVLPAPPRFGRKHKQWLVMNGGEIQRVGVDPPPVLLRIPEEPAIGGENATVARERRTWLEEREHAARAAGTPDPSLNPSTLVDHEVLRALARQGLSPEPGGQKLGTLVHAVLAAIPLDRADLAEEFVRYVAERDGLGEALVGVAIELVRSALADETVRAASRGRCWREVPFTVDRPGAVLEGAIDLVAEAAGRGIVIDFKTDSAGKDQYEPLRALYQPQLEQYLEVIRSLGLREVDGRLLFLREP